MAQAKKTERPDGRKLNETREMEAKVGIIKRADCSAMFRMGKTIAYAAVYGPRELFPGFMQNPEKGILRCNYDMMSFSVTERKRPGPSRRGVEISLVTKNALGPAVNLDQFANTVVDIFIIITQADASTRCAGITAASMALADAGIPMKDLVSAVSVGKVNGRIALDLVKEEEDLDGTTDIPCAIMSRNNEITLLQLDGDISEAELIEAVELAKEGCHKIYEIQKEALKEKYKEIKNE